MSEALARHYAAHVEAVKKHFDAALAAAGYDQVAIFAGGLHTQFLDDADYPFKVNPHFKWWLPLTGAHDSFVVYTSGKKPVLLFYQPDDYWYLPPAAPSGYWPGQFDVRIIKQPDEAREELPPAKRRAFIGEWRERFAGWSFAAANPDALLNPLHYARAAKTEYELECMRLANASAVRGHRAAERAFREGASEFELHNAFVAACGQPDDELAYHAIVALNEHAATLHYQHWQSAKPPKHHAFLIDAGTQYHGYGADITRTYSAEQDEFQQLVNALDGEQQMLGRKVKPGLDYKQLHHDAHFAVARLLHDFDFVKLPAEDIVATGVSRSFFPHGLGHLLGLQVHDVGGFMAGPQGGSIPKPEGHPYLRTTRNLGENFVVTIEPGLYFIPALLEKLQGSSQAGHVNWKKVDAFRRYGGIRIEDNVVARTGAPENLTRDAFKAQA